MIKKGYLEHTSVYLIGAIEHNISGDYGRSWRERAVEFCDKLKIKYFNPLDRPSWMKKFELFIPPVMQRDEVLNRLENESINDIDKNKIRSSQSFVRDVCLRYINSCDFVLCYLPNSKTFGTTEELTVASKAKKPIIMVCPERVPSLWVFDMIKNDKVFSDLGGAFDYLSSIDKGNEILDPLKWVFLKDYPNFELESPYDW